MGVGRLGSPLIAFGRLRSQGVALEKRGEAEAALDAYEAVLEGDPKHWRALFHVGKISMSVCSCPYACPRQSPVKGCPCAA